MKITLTQKDLMESDGLDRLLESTADSELLYFIELVMSSKVLCKLLAKKKTFSKSKMKLPNENINSDDSKHKIY